MSRAVLISIRPKWCELIASGKKTVEVRKTAPHLKTPFKCYIYCTNKGDTLYSVNGKVQPCNSFEINLKENSRVSELNGYVIGDFVCDRIFPIQLTEEGYDYESEKETGLRYEEMSSYLNFRNGYGWHISDLVIYDEPMKLSDIHHDCSQCGYVNARWTNCDFIIKRPPQSWCYVGCAP